MDRNHKGQFGVEHRFKFSEESRKRMGMLIGEKNAISGKEAKPSILGDISW